VAHTFLLDAGRWVWEGNYSERQAQPLPFKGKTLVSWSQDGWFTIVSKLIFPDSTQPELILQYRGKIAHGDQNYTFVLQHSQLGRMEGEGWITPLSIVQRHWVLGDREKRSGLESFRCLNENSYHLFSSVMTGNSLLSTMEATLERITH
jgi:hypothetical protein